MLGRAWLVAIVVATAGCGSSKPLGPVTVDSPPAYTSSRSVVLGGTKPAGSSVWATIDGSDRMLAPVSSETTWTSSEITLNDGENTLQVSARDEAGNMSSTVEVVIIVDQLGPDAPVALTEGTYFRDGNAVLRWEVPNDNGLAGIESYVVNIDGTDYPVDAAAAGSPATFAVPGTLPVLRYEWTVSAIDRAGNAGAVTTSFIFSGVIGDLNGDRFPDFAVGAPFATPTSGTPFEGGVVHVYHGADPLDFVPDAELAGGSIMGQFGASVAIIPDIDGDGRAELLVGSPAVNIVYLFLGGVSGGGTLRQFSGATSGDEFGAVVSGGDLDGDGLSELIIGAPRRDVGELADAGAVYVFKRPGVGFPGAVPAAAAALVITTSTTGARFGSAAAVLGQYDTDPALEFAVGAPRAGVVAGDGAVYVYDAPALAYADAKPLDFSERLFIIGLRGIGFGNALAGGDDVDGDGLNDLVVGADEGSLGRAFVCYSDRSPQCCDINGLLPSGDVGRTVAFLGSADPALGGPSAVAIGTPTYLNGHVSVTEVTTDRCTFSATPLGLQGPGLSESFGSAIAGPGDIDGDGVMELVVGARFYDGIMTLNLGRMHAFSISEDLTVDTDHGQFYPIADGAEGSPLVGAAASARAR